MQVVEEDCVDPSLRMDRGGGGVGGRERGPPVGRPAGALGSIGVASGPSGGGRHWSEPRSN
jgi:hypothetical protein